MNRLKEVILWGAGQRALKFMLTHASVSIKYFIDNDARKCTGINTLLPQQGLAERGGTQIVVTVGGYGGGYGEYEYLAVRSQLLQAGLREFEDFIPDTLFEKKMAILYGNCHIDPIRQFLQASRGFSEVYGFYPLEPVCNLGGGALECFSEVFAHCDLFLHQEIRYENSCGPEVASEKQLQKLPASCRILSFPNLYGLPLCFFPQKPRSHQWEISGQSFFSRDFVVESYALDLAREGREDNTACKIFSEDTARKIERKICAGGIFDHGKIREDFEYFIQKVTQREKGWDIKILDYILENYQTKKLFFDPNHPATPLIAEISVRLLRALGIQEDLNRDAEGKIALNSYEYFIYPDVREALGLTFEDRFIRKGNHAKLCERDMDLYEYIRQYLLWHKEELVEKCGQRKKERTEAGEFPQ